MIMKTYGPDKLTPDQMFSNKQDASEAGHKYYFTGTPCIHNHYSPRYTSNGICVECSSIHNKNYTPNPQKPGSKKIRGKKKKNLRYKDYLTENPSDQFEQIRITVKKGSELHKILRKAKSALESLNLNERYGRKKKTIFEMPRTREEAEQNGQAYYFNWRVCRNGHISPRNLRGECNQCNREAAKRSIKKLKKRLKDQP